MDLPPARVAPSAVAHVLLEPPRDSLDGDALGGTVPELPTFSQGESAPLRGESHLVYEFQQQEKKLPEALQGPVQWDQFLSLCGISFPTEEAAPEQGDEEQESQADTSPCVSSCPQVRRLADALGARRTERLGRVVRELTDSHQVAQREYSEAVNRWSRSRVPPEPVAELLRAKANQHEWEAMRGRVKGWQGAAKDQAWLSWYSKKHAWLQEDLGLAEEHTRALQCELAAMTELGNQLEDASRGVGAVLQQQRGKCDLDRGSKRLQDLEDEELLAAQHERDFMRQKTPQARATLEAERQAAEDLARRLEEARRVAAKEKDAAREKNRELLQQRARRVELQKQRCLRTCTVTKASATRLDLSLRAGAQFSVMQASADGSDGSVRVLLEILARGATHLDEPTGLREQLFGHAWSEIVGGKKQPCDASGTKNAFEAMVAATQVPHVLRRLDCAAVRIADQLQAASCFSSARRSRPGTAGAALGAARGHPRRGARGRRRDGRLRGSGGVPLARGAGRGHREVGRRRRSGLRRQQHGRRGCDRVRRRIRRGSRGVPGHHELHGHLRTTGLRLGRRRQGRQQPPAPGGRCQGGGRRQRGRVLVRRG